MIGILIYTSKEKKARIAHVIWDVLIRLVFL